MSYVSGVIESLAGACGIGHAVDFEMHIGEPGHQVGTDLWTYYNPPALAEAENEGGAGWIVAGFVNRTACRRAYEELNKRGKIVYQSPVRVNRNSRHRFFFAIWDTRK